MVVYCRAQGTILKIVITTKEQNLKKTHTHTHTHTHTQACIYITELLCYIPETNRIL